MGLKILQPYPASQININIRRCWALTLRHEARQHLQYNTLGLHRSGRYKGLQLFPFSAAFPIIHLHTCKFYPIPPWAEPAPGDFDWICSAGPFAGGLKEAFDFVEKGYFAFSSFWGPLIKYSAVRMVWIGSSFSATRTAI